MADWNDVVPLSRPCALPVRRISLRVGVAAALALAGIAVVVQHPSAHAAGPTRNDYAYTALPTQFTPREVEDDGSAVGDDLGVGDAVYRHGALTVLDYPTPPTGAAASAADETSVINASDVVAGYRSFHKVCSVYETDADGAVGATWQPSGYDQPPATFPVASTTVQSGSCPSTLPLQTVTAENDFGQLVLAPNGSTYSKTQVPEITEANGASPRDVATVASISGLGNTSFLGVTTAGTSVLGSIATLALTPLDFTATRIAANGWVSGTRQDGTTVLRSPAGTETTVAGPANLGVDDDGDVIGTAGSGSSFAYDVTLFGGSPAAVSTLLPVGTAGTIGGLSISPAGIIAGYLVTSQSAAGYRGFELAPGAGQLTVSGITLNPSKPTTADKTVTATVTVRNDFSDAVTAVAPTLSSSEATALTVTSGPMPASDATLGAGDTESFAYVLTPKKQTTVTLTATAKATESGGTATTAKAATLVVDLSTGDLSIAVATTPKAPTTSTPVTVTATLTNKTASTLTALTPSLAATPNAGTTVSAATPPTIAALAPHASATVTWTLSATVPATYALKVSVSLTDPTTGAETGTGSGSVVVAAPAIIVTTAGDQPEPASAQADDVCDVDPNTGGDQCTVRAAIQLADHRADTERITFDIPGVGRPVVAPTSPLPVVGSSVTIDGTSQPGGFVDLDGSAAGSTDGLVLTGSGDVVRGLAVTDWAGAGLRLEHAGEVVTGNRIGSADGVTRAGNTIGVRVEAAAVVGGTDGTSRSACTGDCNLISGNTAAGVEVCGAGSGAQILGDWIGPAATGTSVLDDGVGIQVGRDAARPGTAPCPSGVAQPSGVQIGGPSSRAGSAPGDLISGNQVGVQSENGATTTVRGSLIGTDPTGTRSLVDTSLTGSATGVSGWGLQVGGNATTDRDVISGLSAHPGQAYTGLANRTAVNGVGISLFSGLVVGDLIGTDITGTRALDDGVGVRLYGGTLRANVLSGSYAGVVALNGKGAAAAVIVGNRIGTDADGTGAVPNHEGILGADLSSAPAAPVQVGGARATGDRSCDGPCNLISGNDEFAVGDVSTLQGNFIGTDITGTRAIPNDGAPNRPARSAVFGVTTVGGPSSALAGSCDQACNLVSGNRAVFGVSSRSGDEVSGNVIGLGATGQPLPNAAGVLSNGDQTIGGDGDGTGNVIAANTGPAVYVSTAQSDTVSQPTVVVGNSVHSNGGGIAYGPIGLPSSALLAPAIPAGTGGVLAPPTISSTTHAPGERSTNVLTVSGEVPSAYLHDDSAQSYRIDLYASGACDAEPQGATPIGHASFSVLNGASGWHIDIDASPPLGSVLTATLTLSGQTSTWSPCLSAYATGASGSVSPSPVAAGGQVTVTGSGFAPGEQVQATLHSQPIDLGIFTADQTGTVHVTFTVPRDLTPGLHHVVLTGLTSGRTVAVPLTVTTPVSSALPFTGAPVVGLLWLSAVALLGGAVLLAAARRRRT